MEAGHAAERSARLRALPAVDRLAAEVGSVAVARAVLDERRDELLAALREHRERHGHALAALMITDTLDRGTTLLVAGDSGPVHRAYGDEAADGVVPLPGVMSRKKQVAPVLLGAF